MIAIPSERVGVCLHIIGEADKTMFVNEVHKPITEKHGYIVTGKFDELKRDIPYSAIIQAFQDFSAILRPAWLGISRELCAC